MLVGCLHLETRVYVHAPALRGVLLDDSGGGVVLVFQGEGGKEGWRICGEGFKLLAVFHATRMTEC